MRRNFVSLILAALVFLVSSVGVLAKGYWRPSLRTVKLPILYDAHITSSFPDSPYPYACYAPVGHFNPTNMAARYLLYPDLSLLPKQARIKRATLYLKRAFDVWDQDGSYRLHPVLGYWSDRTITWNSQPRFAKKYVVGRRNGDVFEFDVTEFVKRHRGRLPKRGYFGFVIKKPVEEGNNFGVFTTIDCPKNWFYQKPYLRITYEVGFPSPQGMRR